MPKMCIPSPTVLHFRLEPGAVDKKTYPNRDAIFSDLSAAYRKAVKAFYDAGCRYLQFDDTAWAYLCSDVEMKKAKERGMNVATIADDYTRVINDSIKDKPADMVDHHACLPRQLPLDLDFVGRLRADRRADARRHATTTAISWNTTASAPAASSRCASCRRARRSPWSASSPRRAARWRARTPSSAASTRRRSSRRSSNWRFSPQCGFASTEEGNVLTEEQQWAKMREVVEVAEEIWGK